MNRGRRVNRGRVLAAGLTVAVAGVLSGCAGGLDSAQSPQPTHGTLTLPPVAAGVDYQLGEPYPPPEGVSVVVRDSTARPAEGLYNLCYVNAFQSQPAETAWWSEVHPEAVLHGADGAPVSDPGWPDEVLFDTSDAAGREVLVEHAVARLRACADAGFDAVELDNLDSYTRSGGALTVDDNLAYAVALVDEAHALGLAVAQKNTLELGDRGRRAGFDLAIAEECEVFGECDGYTEVYGNHVIEVEYADSADFAAVLDRACAGRGTEISVVGRDRDLGAPDDDGYVRATC